MVLPIPNEAQLAQFADDTAILAISHGTSAITNKLQRAANKLSRYFTKWRVKINGAKSEAVIFTRKLARRHRPRKKLRIAGQEVIWKDSLKYLGMHLDKRLSFKKHIDEIMLKSQRLIKALYPLVCRKSLLSQRNKILMFKTIIRPTICYACPVWATCAATHIKRLQRFQNRTLKMMLNLPWHTRTVDVHNMAEVETLNEFLQKLKTTFREKCEASTDDDIVQLILDTSN